MNKNLTAGEKRMYLPELDGLRFFAFLLVFISHHPLFSELQYFSFLNKSGWMGVDLFFVLSAFLFTKLLIIEYERNQKIDFKKFYIRRIFRIWPVYFLFIAVSLFSYYISDTFYTVTDIKLRIFGLITFSDNIITAYTGSYNLLPFVAHLWTISYEEQFYVFIPFIILKLIRASLKKKIGYLIFLLLMFNMIRVVCTIVEVSDLTFWVLPITHFEAIIMGIIIGFGGCDFLKNKLPRFILNFSSLLFLILLYITPNPYNPATIFWVGLGSSLLLFAVLNVKMLKRVFSQNAFIFLGKRSYGLYVYHWVSNYLSGLLVTHVSGIPSSHTATFFYSLSLTIIMAGLSYEFIEKPFLKLKENFEVVKSRPI